MFWIVYFNLDKSLVLEIFKKINLDFIYPSMIFLVYLICYALFIFKIYDYLFPSK